MLTSPTITTPAAPSGARARAREQAILDAAFELLLEVGYDRMSIDAVAERARASKATIYRHFPDKGALVVATISRLSEVGTADIDTGSLREDLLEFARRASHHAGVDCGLLTGLANAARSDDVIAELLNERMWESKERALAGIVERAVVRGELADASRLPLACEVCCAVVLHRLTVIQGELDEAFRIHLVDEIAIPMLTYRALPPAMSPRRRASQHIE